MWTSDFVVKQTKKGVSDEIWHLWPPKIGGVGEKHPHDSDHAECCDFSAVTMCVYTIFRLATGIATHSSLRTNRRISIRLVVSRLLHARVFANY